jgi:hypothetical protein
VESEISGHDVRTTRSTRMEFGSSVELRRGWYQSPVISRVILVSHRLAVCKIWSRAQKTVGPPTYLPVLAYSRKDNLVLGALVVRG